MGISHFKAAGRNFRSVKTLRQRILSCPVPQGVMSSLGAAGTGAVIPGHQENSPGYMSGIFSHTFPILSTIPTLSSLSNLSQCLLSPVFHQLEERCLETAYITLMIDHLRKIWEGKFTPNIIQVRYICMSTCHKKNMSIIRVTGRAWLECHLDDVWSLRSHFLFQRCLGVWIRWCEQVRGHFEAEEGPSLLYSVLLC